MFNYFVKKINNRKGFTLVELVVVIAILGVLAAIAVPKFTDQTKKAKERACESNRRSLEGALMLHYADQEKFPTLTDDNKLTGEILKDYGFDTIPACPSGGTYNMDEDGKVTCTEHKQEEGEGGVGGGSTP